MNVQRLTGAAIAVGSIACAKIELPPGGPPEDFMQIIGGGPEPVPPPLAEALDFNLDLHELPTRAQRPPRE